MTATLASWYPGNIFLGAVVATVAAATVVVVVAFTASLPLRNHPAIRHRAWVSALAAVLASPLLAMGFAAYGWSFVVLPLLLTEDEAPQRTEFRTEPSPPADMAAVEAPPLLTHVDAEGSSESPSFHQVVGTSVAGFNIATETFRAIVVAGLLAWVGGIVLIAAKLFRSVWHVRRILRSADLTPDTTLARALDEAGRRLGVDAPAQVGVSNLVHAPMAIGLFRPMIILPRGLPESLTRRQLCDVLVHEQAHVERRDNLIVAL